MLIITWIAIVAATAFMASSKNRNVIGWTALSVLFGIFALIAIVFISPKKDDMH